VVAENVSPWPSLPAPAELPRVLSTATARRLGLTRSAVRHAIARRGWQRLVPGIVLTAAGPPTRADWIHVGMELTGRQGALSGWDAVRVMGIGARRAPSEEVLVLDSAGRHRVAGLVRIRPTRRHYHGSPLPCEHPELAFVPIVSAARAVADTALLYRTFAPVRALTTSAIQRRLCTPDEMDAELRSGPRNDSALLRRALADVLDGAQSIAEAEAINLLRTIGAPAFEVNVPIIDHDGRLLAVADLLWRELRAVLEVDSREFHFGEADWKGTTRRHNVLTSRGLALQHYPPSEIRGRGVLWARDVVAWLHARAAELDRPLPSGSGVIRPGPDGPVPLVVPAPPSR
jgi:hypothetical protein